MIFVTVGTQDKQFKRLLIEVERLIKIGKIKDSVIAQIGNTKFKTTLPESNLKIIRFTTPKQMTELIKDAAFIITHGGVGTIIEAMNLEKKIIAVPRLKKYKEHVNDHQLQIIENFNNYGYIIGTKGVEELELALNKVPNFEPKKYASNNKNFVAKLENKLKIL